MRLLIWKRELLKSFNYTSTVICWWMNRTVHVINRQAWYFFYSRNFKQFCNTMKYNELTAFSGIAFMISLFPWSRLIIVFFCSSCSWFHFILVCSTVDVHRFRQFKSFQLPSRFFWKIFERQFRMLEWIFQKSSSPGHESSFFVGTFWSFFSLSIPTDNSKNMQAIRMYWKVDQNVQLWYKNY